MVSALFESGLIGYEILQILAAFIAVIAAVRWKRFEFLSGLFFLFLYTVVELIDTFFFSMVSGIFFDVAQFGFILLAIIFFILGMHTAPRPCMTEESRRDGKGAPPRTESVIFLLKRT